MYSIQTIQMNLNILMHQMLVYTTQVNSSFRVRRLASSEVISQSTIHLWAAEEKQNCLCQYIVTNKVTLWVASYSACVVYTKTIIHLSVGESGGYLPPPWWIITVDYNTEIRKLWIILMCKSRNIHTHIHLYPTDDHWEFQVGGGY